MEPIEELKVRILDLENKKKEIEDLIPWRQTEMPKLAGEIATLKADLHALRNELAAAKKSELPAPESGHALDLLC